MAQEFTNGGNNTANFLQINKDGLLYKWSKEPLEGGQEHKNKDGLPYYTKTFSRTEEGYICKLDIKEDGRFGEELIIGIRGKNESDFISFTMRKQGGGLSDYTKHIARVLADVDFSKRYTIAPSTKKNEKGYLRREFYFNQIDVEGSPFINPSLKYKNKDGEGDIPQMVKKTIAGKDTYDFTEQDNYLYDVLVKQIKRFNEYKAARKADNNSEPSATNVPAESAEIGKVPPVPAAADDDDLPF